MLSALDRTPISDLAAPIARLQPDEPHALAELVRPLIAAAVWRAYRALLASGVRTVRIGALRLPIPVVWLRPLVEALVGPEPVVAATEGA